MAKKDQRVDDYIANAAEFAQPILVHFRALIHEACPDVEETWKWSFPNFMYHGALICSFAAFKKHCAFNFWKAALMQDDDKILTVQERTSMGNLGKIESLNDLPPDEIMIKYIRLAMRLNKEDYQVTPRKKVTEEQKKELVVPEYFIAELEKDAAAKQAFEKFSYSHKKEYLDWITEAKTEPTRMKRIAQTIEWLRDGKGRNWKYEKC